MKRISTHAGHLHATLQYAANYPLLLRAFIDGNFIVASLSTLLGCQPRMKGWVFCKQGRDAHPLAQFRQERSMDVARMPKDDTGVSTGGAKIL